jgi:uncharacterized protein (DUF697 family)
MSEETTKIELANSTVKNYMLGALGVGLVPYPFIDIALLTAIQLKMLHSLAKVYQLDFPEELGRKVITSCLGSVIPVSLSFNLTQLLNYNWLAKGVSTSVFSGAFTYAIGKLFIQHFESGNTFLTFDPEQVKAYFASQFEQGKKELTRSFVGVKP